MALQSECYIGIEHCIFKRCIFSKGLNRVQNENFKYTNPTHKSDKHVPNSVRGEIHRNHKRKINNERTFRNWFCLVGNILGNLPQVFDTILELPRPI